MTVDFFIGKRNKEIVERAMGLGFGNVIFIKEAKNLDEIRKDDNFNAILIITKSLELFRRMVDKASNYFSIVLVLGTSDVINRAALEHKKVHALVSPEYGREYDYTNYRNSGLNQVLCKIAKDNGKKIILSFNDILKKKNEERAMLIGRIMQNITLCRKYKTEIRFYSFASTKEELRAMNDLKSFCLAIGAMPEEANKIFNS